MPIHHAHIGDDAAIRVIHGVEDHGASGSLGVAGGRRDTLHDAVEQLFDALPGLAAHAQHVLGRPADEARELARVLLRVGRRQVDLVEHGDDREVVLEREVQVRERLRLNALRGIHEQDRALAGRQGYGSPRR